MAAPTPTRGSPVARRITQTFGTVILAGTAWQAAVLLAALCFLLQVGCSRGRQLIEPEACKATDQGNAAYEDALVEWGRVADRYPDTSAWGAAV